MLEEVRVTKVHVITFCCADRRASSAEPASQRKHYIQHHKPPHRHTNPHPHHAGRTQEEAT